MNAYAPKNQVACALAVMLTFMLLGCTNSSLQPFDGRVLSVHDGDTLSVSRGGQIVRIRLARVDAPELAQDFGQQSRDRLKLLCANDVHVTPVGVDRDERVIADIMADGRDVNEELVREGSAWWYRSYDKGDSTMESLESAARTQHQGLWNGHQPLPPWEFRKEKRQKALYLRNFKRNAIIIGVVLATFLICVSIFWVRRRTKTKTVRAD